MNRGDEVSFDGTDGLSINCTDCTINVNKSPVPTLSAPIPRYSTPQALFTRIVLMIKHIIKF